MLFSSTLVPDPTILSSKAILPTQVLHRTSAVDLLLCVGTLEGFHLDQHSDYHRTAFRVACLDLHDSQVIHLSLSGLDLGVKQIQVTKSKEAIEEVEPTLSFEEVGLQPVAKAGPTAQGELTVQHIAATDGLKEYEELKCQQAFEVVYYLFVVSVHA